MEHTTEAIETVDERGLTSPEVVREQVTNGIIDSFDIIVAHPDDELYMLGYILESLPPQSEIPEGFKINLHYMTSGERGGDRTKLRTEKNMLSHKEVQKYREMVGEKRELESVSAWRSIFGSAASNLLSFRFYGLPDGGLDKSVLLKPAIEEVVADARERKSKLFTIDNSEKHFDHEAVMSEVEAAGKDSKVLLFTSSESIDDSWNAMEVSKVNRLKVRRFIQHHRSQYDSDELQPIIEDFMVRNRYHEIGRIISNAARGSVRELVYA